jgi:hypothetical protein
MNQLTEFQQHALSAGLVKMFVSKHFDICTLDSLAKLADVQTGGKDYQALRAVHCIDWGDMSPQLATQVREKCLEILGLPPQIIDITTRERQEEQAEPKRPSLAFWRR